MKDHETMRNEQADRELDLRAKLIRAKQANDRDQVFRTRAMGDGFVVPEPLTQRLHRFWKVA